MLQELINIIWSYTRHVITLPTSNTLQRTRVKNFFGVFSNDIDKYTSILNPNLVRLVKYEDGGLFVFYKNIILLVKTPGRNIPYKGYCYYSINAKNDIESIIRQGSNADAVASFVLNLMSTRNLIQINDITRFSCYN